MSSSFTSTRARRMLLGARNHDGLTDEQIRSCERVWRALCGKGERRLDTSEAGRHGSRTRYDEDRRTVILGADAYEGPGQSANARMSMQACLAHELAHLRRAQMGFRRPAVLPDAYLDEAETSIFASFLSPVARRDREDLVEDARDRLIAWIAAQER